MSTRIISQQCIPVQTKISGHTRLVVQLLSLTVRTLLGIYVYQYTILNTAVPFGSSDTFLLLFSNTRSERNNQWPGLWSQKRIRELFLALLHKSDSFDLMCVYIWIFVSFLQRRIPIETNGMVKLPVVFSVTTQICDLRSTMRWTTG